MKVQLSSIDDSVERLANGEFVILLDDNGGGADLVIRADHVTIEKMAFMLRFANGLICVPIAGSRLDALDIPLISCNALIERPGATPFAVSVDAAEGTSTGISARDRLQTVLALIDPESTPRALSRPGHMFPVRCPEPGYLRRNASLPEVAFYLTALEETYPAALTARILNDDGSIAGASELWALAQRYDIWMARSSWVLCGDVKRGR